MNKNFIRILISGGVATVIQKASGLSPVSLVGFGLFIVVFMMVSFAFHAISSQKEKLSDLEQELENTRKRLRAKKLSKIYKIIFSIIFGYIVLNSAINFISFKYDLFNSGFKHNYNTSSATIINTTKAIKKFSYKKMYFSIYQYQNKYYILQTNKFAKNNHKYLTLYSTTYLYKIKDAIKSLKNCQEVSKNISPVIYKEINTMQMIFTPLWLVNNSIKQISWDTYSLNKLQKECKQIQIDRKKYKQKQEYNKIKVKDLSTLSTKQLAVIIKKLYKHNAFIKDTRYAIKVFDEFNSRTKKQINLVKKIDVYGYQFELMRYLNLFRKKENLNKILQNYNYGVVYSFLFPVFSQPLDIAPQKYSHLRLVDLKNHKRYIFHTHNLENIKDINSTIIIKTSNMPDIVLKNISKKDTMIIVKQLKDLIKYIGFIEKRYYSKQ